MLIHPVKLPDRHAVSKPILPVGFSGPVSHARRMVDGSHLVFGRNRVEIPHVNPLLTKHINCGVRLMRGGNLKVTHQDNRQCGRKDARWAVECGFAQVKISRSSRSRINWPMSQARAKREKSDGALMKEIDEPGVVMMAQRRGTALEEAPWAYKDVENVVDVCHHVGIAKKVARWRPLGVVKG
jgi:RNA-splicing ligase RtcB